MSTQRGQHPNSLLNLDKGRETVYSEAKVRRNFTITPTADEGLKRLAEKLGVSKSELIEQIGRGLISINN
ncbi:MAG: ribbon-helix-helix domain-containing protein [Xenococcaceae cyanobacterium]